MQTLTEFRPSYDSYRSHDPCTLTHHSIETRDPDETLDMAEYSGNLTQPMLGFNAHVTTCWAGEGVGGMGGSAVKLTK